MEIDLSHVRLLEICELQALRIAAGMAGKIPVYPVPGKYGEAEHFSDVRQHAVPVLRYRIGSPRTTKLVVTGRFQDISRM
jgi:hypothetical protein